MRGYHCRSIRAPKGFTLIEIMIAIILTLILTSCVFEMFIATAKSINLQKNLQLIQFNKNKVMHIFESELHKAGQIGCNHWHPSFLKTNFLIDQKPVSGNQSELIVRYADFPGVALLSDMKNNFTMMVSNQESFNVNDVVVISDCLQGEILNIKSIKKLNSWQIIQAETPLQYRYQKNAELSKWREHRFFVALKTLMLQDEHHRKLKLISGIDELQIHYSFKGDKLIGIAVQFTAQIETLTQQGEVYIAIRNNNA